MVLEKYSEMIYRCIRCGFCRKSTYEAIGIDKICPIYEFKSSWDFNCAKGKVSIARGLLEGAFEVTDELVQTVYSCTTCGNCKEICLAHFPSYFPNKKRFPGELEPLDTVKVIEALRAEIVARKGPLDKHKQIADNIKNTGNPYREPRKGRFDWVPKELKIPKKASIAYFAGCTAPYRLPKVCRDTVRILQKANVEFTILDDEICCGSVLYRTGQWNLANEVIKSNLETFRKHDVNEIVTACAGCYRTLKLDYPEKCGSRLDYKVTHITELLNRLIKDDSLKFEGRFDKRLTYHDPCHLGRACKIYDPPREVLKSIPGVMLAEMKPSRQKTICCGAGGGLKSLDGDLATSIAAKRLERAHATKAEAIVSACPFCELNLAHAVEKIRSPLRVYDLVEIVATALTPGRAKLKKQGRCSRPKEIYPLLSQNRKRKI